MAAILSDDSICISFRFKTPTGPYFLGNTQQSWTATRNGQAWASGKTPIDNIGPRFNGFVGVKNYEQAAEERLEPIERQRVFRIAPRPRRLFVHLEKDAVDAGGDAGGCERFDELCLSGGHAIAGARQGAAGA